MTHGRWLWGVLLLAAMGCRPAVPDGYTAEPEHGACVDGEVEACYAFGQRGQDATVARRRASLIAYRYGCHLGHPDSCAEFAAAMGQKKSQKATVRSALEQACQGGNAKACVDYADALPPYQAADYYQRACDGSNGDGCARLASRLRDQWRLEDQLTKAYALEIKGCEMGSAEACAAAGQALLFGSGIEADPAQGLELLGKTCNDEIGIGCLRLARIYETGIGVQQDLGKANTFYEQASIHNTAPVATSPASAFVIYVDGCNQGDPLGCYNAGWDLAEGINAPRNISTSRAFFDKACQDGLETACDQWKKIKPAGEVVTQEPL